MIYILIAQLNKMNDEEKMITCKVVLLGDSGVGKTSIIQNYIFKRYNYKDTSTIAANFQSKIMNLQNEKKKLNLKFGIQQDKKNIIL